MEKDKKEIHQDKDNDELNNALDGFDQNPLNLTNQDKPVLQEEDPQMAAKIKAEYQKFMDDMKNINSSPGDDEIFNNLTGMLGGLLKNLTQEMGQPQSQQDFKKSFEGFFSGLKDDNVEDAAEKLLGQFMDKSLLYQPLKETRQGYDKYFEKEKGKIPQTDLQRYKKQYSVIERILQVLNTNPQDKKTLINLFQQLQQYGKPPNGINDTMGMMYQ